MDKKDVSKNRHILFFYSQRGSNHYCITFSA